MSLPDGLNRLDYGIFDRAGVDTYDFMQLGYCTVGNEPVRRTQHSN